MTFVDLEGLKFLHSTPALSIIQKQNSTFAILLKKQIENMVLKPLFGSVNEEIMTFST